MSRDTSIQQDSRRVIATQFGLEFDEEGPQSIEDREHAFRALLIERIVALLTHDMERLMNILYRVDVSEELAAQAFRDNAPEHIAPALADLIIARQLAKAETRARYRDGI